MYVIIITVFISNLSAIAEIDIILLRLIITELNIYAFVGNTWNFEADNNDSQNITKTPNGAGILIDEPLRLNQNISVFQPGLRYHFH